jgi:hypothetical protein
MAKKKHKHVEKVKDKDYACRKRKQVAAGYVCKTK